MNGEAPLAGQPASPGNAAGPGGAAPGNEPGNPVGTPDNANPGAVAQGAGGQADGAVRASEETPTDPRGIGDGRSLAGARSQVGAHLTDQRRESRRALADFDSNQINGSVYAGNTFHLAFGQGPATIRASLISEKERFATFVRGPGSDHLASVLDDAPLILLHGPKGTGKQAALVWAFRQELDADVPMYYLHPETDLATFTCADFPEQSALIIADLPGPAADRLDEHVLRHVEGQLRSRKIRLGITTEQFAGAAAGTAGCLVIRFDGHPRPRDVFDRHLAKRLLGGSITKEKVLAWPGVASLLDARLDDDCPLADAERLARLLFEARDNPDQAARVVSAKENEYSDERIAQWFRGLPSLKAHCTAISLAVLNGESREVIAHQAALLERRILPAPDAPNAPDFSNPFDTAASVTPAVLNAQVTDETRTTEQGPVFIQAMSYRESGYPGRVLRHAWGEYDDGRAAIVEWLRSLGRSASLPVRVRAATATGILARAELNFLYDEIIRPWAQDAVAEVRESAAIALQPSAEDPVLGPTVEAIIGEMARKDSSWRLRATAARAWGSSLGMASPKTAMDKLAALAAEDDLDVMMSVAKSYAELAVNGPDDQGIQVLNEVIRVSTDRIREKQVTGRLTLLGLSYQRGAPPALARHDERLKDWPTLLLLALRNSVVADQAARLWQVTIPDRDLGSMAMEALDEWAQTAEEGPRDLRDSFVRFTCWIAADNRALLAIRRRAELWAADGHRTGSAAAACAAPETGRIVLKELSR